MTDEDNRIDFSKLNSKLQARIPDPVLEKIDVGPEEGIEYLECEEDGVVKIQQLSV
jgi:hypothetical protein